MLGYSTLPELAATLGVRTHQLDYLIRTRQIPVLRVGNYRLIGPESQAKIRQELEAKEHKPSLEDSNNQTPAPIGPSFPALVSSF